MRVAVGDVTVDVNGDAGTQREGRGELRDKQQSRHDARKEMQLDGRTAGTMASEACAAYEGSGYETSKQRVALDQDYCICFAC
jgi:carbon monoxide dehydrogenase subunit G